MEINDLTGLIVHLSIKIHSRIGPGCFEKVYEEILLYELSKRGISCQYQLLLPIKYESLTIDKAYRLDILVDNRLILEIKSVPVLSLASYKQLRTYLGLAGLKHGMILNFQTNLMKDGIHRVYNNFGEEEL